MYMCVYIYIYNVHHHRWASEFRTSKKHDFLVVVVVVVVVYIFIPPELSACKTEDAKRFMAFVQTVE